ncbi:hypothetical protein A3Q56_05665 [Intoshia linei]|uniref:Uncharacterized protein n=1 Tax=Intoshia linei TaxID=1819745 RepID=A0A177AZL0_9BILA|nr:hypothetical protein A3Q56_05665 [Intoshia linei]
MSIIRKLLPKKMKKSQEVYTDDGICLETESDRNISTVESNIIYENVSFKHRMSERINTIIQQIRNAIYGEKEDTEWEGYESYESWLQAVKDFKEAAKLIPKPSIDSNFDYIKWQQKPIDGKKALWGGSSNPVIDESSSDDTENANRARDQYYQQIHLLAPYVAAVVEGNYSRSSIWGTDKYFKNFTNSPQFSGMIASKLQSCSNTMTRNSAYTAVDNQKSFDL